VEDFMRRGFILAIAAGALLGGTRAHASSYTITTNAMTQAWDGACSLLEAINASNTFAADHECPAGTGVDDITLSGGTYTTTVPLAIINNVTISGSGLSVIAANFASTQYDVLLSVGGQLTIDNVTVRNDTNNASVFTTGIGVWDNGSLTSHDRLRVTGFTWGGIYLQNASLNLDHGRIDHNTNLHPDPAWNHGAGIWVNNPDGTTPHGVELLHSSIVFNQAAGNGGGLFFGASGGSHLDYNTYSNNSAARGGGLYIATNSPGYFESYHQTIGLNTASVSGGGVEEHHMGSELAFNSSVIANNTAPTGANMVRNGSGGISQDNIWGAGVTSASLGCTTTWTCTHNTFGADAKFGPTMTMGGVYYFQEMLPLLKGSPAVDFGTTSGNESQDARGMSGNQDGDNNGSTGVDAGAFEKNLVWQSEENLEFFSSSGDLVNIDVGTGYSGGLGRRLDANANNDYVKYVIPIAEAGTYDVTVKFKRASNGGKFFVGFASSQNGTYTELPSEQDCFSANTTFPAAVSLGSQTFNAAGKFYVRFRVSGQTAGSTGRVLFQDYVKVRKTN
jgi:hypothetical protein